MITPEGFERPSFDEIREALVDRARELYGSINTGSESAIGQQISIQAEREALMWDALEAVYLNQYPRSASGFSLDGAVALTGISRLPATRTSVVVELSGDPSTVIPAGSQASTDAGDIFELVTEVTLDGSGEGQGQMLALEAGPELALAGTVTNIETPVSGWDEVNNPDDGQVGRDIESDPELRVRQSQSLAVTGAGTVPAIRSRLLQEVDDVTAVTIIENRSDEVDGDGRPPHSFESVVSGGIDQDVADLLWQVKPAGIETHGDLTLQVEDSQGELQTIRFSRPVPKYVWINVVLTENGVGTFPDDWENATKQALVEYGEALGVGDDIIYQALFGPIYANVPGIGNVEIEVAVNDDPNTQPAVFETENISIGSNEITLWLADRIEVSLD